MDQCLDLLLEIVRNTAQKDFPKRRKLRADYLAVKMLPEETWEKFQTKWESVLLNMEGQSMTPSDLELYHRLQEIIALDVISKIMTNQKPKDDTELMQELEEYYTVID